MDYLLALLSSAATTLGLFLGALLWQHKKNRNSNRWLAAFMVSVALLCFDGVLYYWPGVLGGLPDLAYLFDPLMFLLGPLLYEYTRTLTGATRSSARGWVLHCLPAIACLAVLIFLFHLQPAEVKRRILQDDSSYDPGLGLFDILGCAAVIQMLGYGVAAARLLKRYRERLKKFFSDIDRLRLGWLNRLFSVSCLLLVFEAVANTIPGQLVDWLTTAAPTLGVFALGYMGLRQPQVFSLPPEIEGPYGTPAPKAANSSTPAVQVGKLAPAKKYAKSGLQEDSAIEYIKRLDLLMEEEKPYLENELTLSELADRLGCALHYLSESLNRYKHTNFYDFISQYRVKEAQRLLEDPANAELSVLDIGFKSGFNSKPTFNKAFKEQTGETPSAYRRRCLGHQDS